MIHLAHQLTTAQQFGGQRRAKRVNKKVKDCRFQQNMFYGLVTALGFCMSFVCICIFLSNQYFIVEILFKPESQIHLNQDRSFSHKAKQPQQLTASRQFLFCFFYFIHHFSEGGPLRTGFELQLLLINLFGEFPMK